jgi:hypothetical protein
MAAFAFAPLILHMKRKNILTVIASRMTIEPVSGGAGQRISLFVVIRKSQLQLVQKRLLGSLAFVLILPFILVAASKRGNSKHRLAYESAARI